MPEDDRANRRDDREQSDRPDRRRASESRSSGLSFSLPPIYLPPLFPDHMEIRLPVPGFRYGTRLSSGWVLLVALGFDLADALLATATTGPVAVVRTLGGLMIAVTLARGLGLFYLWEVGAVLLGYGAATVLPTLTAVLALWLWRSR